MEKKSKSRGINILIGSAILGSSLIWGAVIVGCSLKLSGTECYDNISNILILAASFHLLLVWVPLAATLKKLFKKDELN